MSERVLIVGGGISGLSTAYYLGRQGFRSVLLEKSPRLGGLIRTDHVSGCDLEAGPDSFLASKPSVLQLAKDLGIEDRLIDANEAARRVFIGRNAKLVPMPSGMVMMAPADLDSAYRSPFFSEETKALFAQELEAQPRERAEDVALGDFVRDHFGSEVLETIAEPLLTGVYGGDPAGLSLRSVLPRFLDYERQYGSVIRGVQIEHRQRKNGTSLFRSFQNGMQTLTDALAAAIGSTTEVVHEEAANVSRTPAGAWTVSTSTASFSSDTLILAAPAHVGSRLLAEVSPQLSKVLGQIPYSSAILVTQVFPRATIGHPLDGFGFLIPRTERTTAAAATWISTKFPSRTPQSLAAIRTFLVGEQALRLMNAPDDEVVAAVRADLARWMNLKNEPNLSLVSRWPYSMPQYVVGHSERVVKIRTQTAMLPGLHLVGNAYDGVGIPDCVRFAKMVANTVAAPSM